MNSALPEFLRIMQDPNTESVARVSRARVRAEICVSRYPHSLRRERGGETSTCLGALWSWTPAPPSPTRFGVEWIHPDGQHLVLHVVVHTVLGPTGSGHWIKNSGTVLEFRVISN